MMQNISEDEIELMITNNAPFSLARGLTDIIA
jgi:hypothetical protein